jgi:hypothetical protein
MMWIGVTQGARDQGSGPNWDDVRDEGLHSPVLLGWLNQEGEMGGTFRTCTKEKERVQNLDKLRKKYHLRDLDAE